MTIEIEQKECDMTDLDQAHVFLGRFSDSIESSKYSLVREGMPPDAFQNFNISLTSLLADLWAIMAINLLIAKGHKINAESLVQLKTQAMVNIDAIIKMAESVKVTHEKAH